MPRKKKSEISHEAKVGDYPERPYDEAKADPDDIAETEDRQPDQIADYHETHPTLGKKTVVPEEPAT